MLAFLKLVLTLIVALVIVLLFWAVLVYFWLRSKVRNLTDELSGKFAKEFEAMQLAMSTENVPPMRIELIRFEGYEWENREQLQVWEGFLIEKGFRLIGDFEVQPTLMQLRAFLNEEAKAYAVIYEHPKIGLWYDLVSLKQDGTSSFTLSNGQDHRMDQREGHPQFRVTPLTNPNVAFEKFLEERPAESWEEVSSGEFVARFERAYAAEMDWRIQRGGPTEEELLRIAEHDGTECTPENVSAIQAAWKMRAACEYEDELYERYLSQSQLSAKEWDEIQDQLFFVNQLTSTAEMFEQIQEYSDDLEMSIDELLNAINSICNEQVGVQAFDDILSHFELTDQFPKHGSLSQPIPTTVYLIPMLGESDVDF